MTTTIKIKKETLKLLKEKKGNKSYSSFINDILKEKEINERLIKIEDLIHHLIYKIEEIEKRLTIEKYEPKIILKEKTSNKIELPSFLKNNPWVEILNKRGRE
ncbi:MAG: hypothetical protein QXI58_06875 [Candidatus Micrarchaeia archaeon]